jgi:hypothetical protein
MGLLFFALFLYAILHVFSKPTNDKRDYGILAISAVGVGFFYPFHWLGVLICCFSCCLILYSIYGQKVIGKIVAVLASVVGGSLVTLPYLSQITSGKHEATALTWASPSHILKYGFMYFLTALPLSVILFWKREALLDILHAKTKALFILIAVVITTALMYSFTSGPLGIEYKYAILSYFSLGILCSICFADIYLKNRVICFILTSSFLLPFSTYMFLKVKAYKFDYSYIVEDGVYLRHRNPIEDKLYQWISNKTAHDAFFIDSKLPTIALFGRRQVFYGQPSEENWSPKILGWYQPFEFLGYPREKIEARKKIVEEIYSDSDVGTSNTRISENVLSALNSINNTSDVYVVARDTRSNKKLADDEHFHKIFESGKTAIYKLLKPSNVSLLTNDTSRLQQKRLGSLTGFCQPYLHIMFSLIGDRA